MSWEEYPMRSSQGWLYSPSRRPSERISARLWACLSACSATGANVGNDGLNGLAARLVANVLRPKQSVGSCYGRPGRIFRPACGSSVPVLLCLRHGSRHGEDEDC